MTLSFRPPPAARGSQPLEVGRTTFRARRTRTSSTAVVVNGRYRHLETGGFRRFAEETAARLDDAVTAYPPSTMGRGAAGRFWEQAVLPAAAAGRVLYSPANSGPLGHPRHVLTIHDVFPLSHPGWYAPGFVRLQRQFLPLLARRAHRVVVPSLAVADEVMRLLGVVGARIDVVAPGVGAPFGPMPSNGDGKKEEQLRARIGLEEGDRLVAGLLSRNRRKNGRHLLDVLEAVRAADPSIKVAVAGSDDPPRVLAGGPRPRQSGIVDLGYVSDADLAALFRTADVFVWLPLAEGFGMPLLEAAACGTPSVTTPVPAATEQLSDHCTRVPADDVAAAVTAVRARLDEPERSIDGQAVPARHSWDRTAAEVGEILASVGP